MAKQVVTDRKTFARQLYYGKQCSITIQLERLSSTFDGTDQLAQAIFRKVKEWNDVWASCQVRISNPMTTDNWSNDQQSNDPIPVVKIS